MPHVYRLSMPPEEVIRRIAASTDPLVVLSVARKGSRRFVSTIHGGDFAVYERMFHSGFGLFGGYGGNITGVVASGRVVADGDQTVVTVRVGLPLATTVVFIVLAIMTCPFLVPGAFIFATSSPNVRLILATLPLGALVIAILMAFSAWSSGRSIRAFLDEVLSG